MSGDGNGDGLLPLSQVLAELGASFRDAERRAEAQQGGPVMGWSEATLELETVLTRDGSGKIRAWVIEAGGGVSRAETVKISVTLSPWDEPATKATGGGAAKRPVGKRPVARRPVAKRR